MTDEIVQIIRGTYATEDNVRTQAEEALSRLDKGGLDIKTWSTDDLDNVAGGYLVATYTV